MHLDQSTLPESRRPKLRSLVQSGAPIRAIEVHSGLSAMVCSQAVGPAGLGPSAQFDAFWVSSLTGSASRGLPDMEMYAVERRLELVDEVCHATTRPIIVDGDTGGEATALEYLSVRLEAMGVSAVVVEDKQHPKRNSLSLDSSHVLEQPDLFAAKIRRARRALRSDSFMIFARLESLIAGETVEDALRRAEIYVAAGAHGVMIHSKDKDAGPIFEFLDRFRRLGYTEPVICVPTTYNSVRAQELFDRGAQIVIHANHMLRAAHFAMRQACETILANDRTLELDNMCTPVTELFRLVGYDAALQRERDASLPKSPVSNTASLGA